jgi:hypothetical protein
LAYEVAAGITGGSQNDEGKESFRAVGKNDLSGAWLSYQITANKNVKISVYNIEGRLMANLINANQNPGSYQLNWDASNSSGTRVPSGIYFCRAAIGNNVYCAKIVVLK